LNAGTLVAVDSSVAIAAFAPWHERHEDARGVLATEPRLVAHAALETFSVLTRLPSPFTAPSDVVLDFCAEAFPDEQRLALGEEAQRRCLRILASAGLRGGEVYDGVIALTAREAGARLVSLDGRAAAVYTRVGAEAEIL
jgi:predicted nucleic acid-binding protein